MEKKKLCKLLNGKWKDELQACELLLKDIQIKDEYLYITFENSTIVTHSYDMESGLPNYLSVDLHTPQENKLSRKMHKAPLESPERKKIIEKLKDYTHFDDLITKE